MSIIFFFSAYAFVDYEDRRDAEVNKFLVIRFQNNSSFFFSLAHFFVEFYHRIQVYSKIKWKTKGEWHDCSHPVLSAHF